MANILRVSDDEYQVIIDGEESDLVDWGDTVDCAGKQWIAVRTDVEDEAITADLYQLTPVKAEVEEVDFECDDEGEGGDED